MCAFAFRATDGPVTFFPKASFSNSFCMPCSANAFFSRRFSSSSALVCAIIDASVTRQANATHSPRAVADGADMFVIKQRP
jgi:hypothetical protein